MRSPFLASLTLALTLYALADRTTAQQERDHWFSLREHPAFERTYTTGVALRFDEDAEIDYLGIADSNLVLWSAIESHDSLTTLPVLGNDVERLPDYAPGTQAVLVPGPFGLNLCRYESGVFTTSIVGDTAWEDAIDVETADFLGSDGRIDAFGLDETGTSLLRLKRLADGSFDPQPSISLPAPALQIETLDIDGDGTPELGVRFLYGADVRNSSGVRQYAVVTFPSTTVAITKLHDTTAGADRLALVSSTTSKDHWLHLYGTTSTSLLDHALAPYQVVTCTGADTVEGGVEELHANLSSHQGMVRYAFTNVTTPPTSEFFHISEDWDSGNPAPDNAATIVAVDVDIDTDIDLILPSNADDVIQLFRNQEEDEHVYIPSGIYTTISASGDLEVTYQIPQIPGMDTFQLLIWGKVVDPVTDEWQVDPAYPLAVREADATVSNVYQSQFSLGGQLDDFLLGTLVLLYQARLVRLDGSGDTVLSGPTYVSRVFGVESSLTELLAEAPFAEDDEIRPWDESPGGGFGGGGDFPERTAGPNPNPPLFP